MATDGYPEVSISEHGFVSEEKPMMKEILLHGPIACGVDAIPIISYVTGIAMKEDHDLSIDHVISVVGWGEDEETGVKFWEVRNNWGEYWGEDGWFRVERGVNALAIEEACFWAKPKAWGHLTSNSTSAWDEKNYDESTVEAFHKTLIKQTLAKSSMTEMSASSSASGESQSPSGAGRAFEVGVGLVVGAAFVVAAFVGGRRVERAQLYMRVSNTDSA